MTWTIGQKVVVVSSTGREMRIDDATIKKVGRKWLTVQRDGWRCDERFDFDGRSDQDYGYRPTLWLTRAAYEAHAERRRLWDEARSLLRDRHMPPDHLNADQIVGLITTIRGPL